MVQILQFTMTFNGYCVAALMAEVLTLYKIPIKGANEILFCNIMGDKMICLSHWWYMMEVVPSYTKME